MAKPDRLVAFHDCRTGAEFLMCVPPSSPWFDLLPPVQEAEIREQTPEEIAERDAYRNAGGVWLPQRPAAQTK